VGGESGPWVRIATIVSSGSSSGSSSSSSSSSSRVTKDRKTVEAIKTLTNLFSSSLLLSPPYYQITSTKKEIPTPIVEEVTDYEQLVDTTFKLPLSYIRTKKHPLLQGGEE